MRKTSIRKHLLDVNVLIALTEPAHTQRRQAQDWFYSTGETQWAVCPLTEAGLIRITTNPAYRPVPRSIGQCAAILQMLKAYPGYSYWHIDSDWVTLTAPFAVRVSGQQQITDAYLLGLAIKKEGVLVTFDKGIRYMAGTEFSQNVFVIE